MRTYENMFDPLVQELLKQKQQYESLVQVGASMFRVDPLIMRPFVMANSDHIYAQVYLEG